MVLGIEIVIFLLGVIVGLIIAVSFSRWKSEGTLKIDHSDPETDKYLIEIEDLDKIDKKSVITLKVDHNAKISQ